MVIFLICLFLKSGGKKEDFNPNAQKITMNKKNIYAISLLVSSVLPAVAQNDSVSSASRFVNQTIEVGANKNFTRKHSTAAVTVIENKDVNKRSAKNIGNSIIGQGGNGLVSLQNAGLYYAADPTFYVRGLQY